MKGFKRVLFFLLAGLLTGAATLPLSAQVVTIPESATITSAVFSIVTYGIPSNQIVSAHRIAKSWDEPGVTWNNFMPGPVDPPSFDPAPFASFSTAVNGWHVIDVTALVQAWVNGSLPNYGILLEQGLTPYTLYLSSEFASNPAMRPKLDIFYTTSAGSFHVTIQRPDLAQDGVADAWISQMDADFNHGNATPLYTGNIGGFEKLSLVRFYFEVVPDHPSPGTGTPGYWMNHPEAWPVEWIVIGGVTYTKDQAIAIMKTPTSTDMTYQMFQHLVAAELNVLIGNASGCIASTITAAQDWMTVHPLGSGVKAKGSAWGDIGEPLKDRLDDYNNGLLCAAHRD
jgi:hypothetical protein